MKGSPQSALSMTERREGIWALVPVKAPGRGKTRLASLLGAESREQCVAAMLSHAMAQLNKVGCLAAVGIISPQPRPLGNGEIWIRDTGNGLNTAVCQGVTHARARGANSIVILPADLPGLHWLDVVQLITQGQQHGVAIAPDRFRCGTNGLFFDTSCVIPAQFGRDSFRKHFSSARAQGKHLAIVDLPGLAWDLDLPEDWHFLQNRSTQSAADMSPSAFNRPQAFEPLLKTGL